MTFGFTKGQLDPSVSGYGSAFDSTSQAPVDSVELPELKAFTFSVENIQELIPFQDTLLQNHSQQYDPIRRRAFDHLSLGNLGSAAYSSLWQKDTSINLDPGFHQFDLYNINSNVTPFLLTNRTLMEARFSQTEDQENIQLEARFAKEFEPGIKTSLDYKRISSEGNYRRQKTQHTNLNTGIWIDRDRWDAVIAFHSNVNEAEESNGVSDLTQYENSINNNRTNIPIFSEEAFTRIQEKKISLSTFFKLDSASVKHRLQHESSYRSYWFKYSDTSPNADFYDSLQVDDRGLRHFVRLNTLSNKIGYTFNNKITVLDSLDQSKSYQQLDVNILSQTHWSVQEPDNDQINDIFLNGIYRFKNEKWIDFEGKLNYGLIDAANTLDLEASLYKSFKNKVNLKARFNIIRRRPTLVENKLILINTTIWKNDFDKINTFHIDANLQIPSINLSITGGQSIVTNYIYFGIDRLPIQSKDPLSISFLTASQKLKLGWFNLESYAFFQQINQSYIQLPNWMIKESIYFENFIFKKAMLMKTGFDFRLFDRFITQQYTPLIGQFHIGNELEATYYPLLDYFINFKVANFEAFGRVQNTLAPFIPGVHYYVNRHPAYDLNFRFGIKWSFLD